jgi:acetyl esterase/lipase
MLDVPKRKPKDLKAIRRRTLAMAIAWVALSLAAVTLLLALWIVVPAPTYFLLTFGVGAPEVSPWIALAAIIAAGLSLHGVRDLTISRIAAAAAAVAFGLAVIPLARFRSTAREFETLTKAMSLEPKSPARTKHFSLGDFVTGVDVGEAKITRDVEFAKPGGISLALDVYQPTTAGRYPVLVQIYGGRWQNGKPSDDGNFATLMASHGWVVFAIDYRHAPMFRWTSILADIDSSLVWIRNHAAEYGGDTSRVALLGRSAGGHLAMMAAYRAPPMRIRGVVSYYGPVDLAEAYSNPPNPDPLRIRPIEEMFIGGPLADRLSDYQSASPISYANRPQPPTLLLYGRRDHIVEAKYGERLHAALVAAGTPAAYLEIPWAEHAFDTVFNGLSSQLTLYHVERFLGWTVRMGSK